MRRLALFTLTGAVAVAALAASRMHGATSRGVGPDDCDADVLPRGATLLALTPRPLDVALPAAILDRSRRRIPA